MEQFEKHGVCAVRGAITCENTEEGILAATRELLESMLSLNGIAAADIISVIFTQTADLTAAYPARAARDMGVTQAGLLCMAEADVHGSLRGCVRVLMHVSGGLPQKDAQHVYLRDARVLRPDITEAKPRRC